MPDSSTGTYMLEDLVLDRVDLVTAGANPGATIMIMKMDVPDTISGESEPVEAPDVQAEEVTMSEETPVDMIAKAELDAVQKQLDDMAAALEVAKAEAASNADEVAKMARERKAGEFVAKAKDLANLGEPEPLGAILLEVSEKVDDTTFKQLEQLLKAANAQLEKGALFATFGKQDADTEPEEFEAKVTRKAKVLFDAGEAKTLEIAKLRVMQSDKELREEYAKSARRA